MFFEATILGVIGIPLGIMFVFVLQFSLVNYNINMRMISEKEAKLDILLERQGIGEVKYILSWFINYLLVGLITDIVLIITMIVLMKTLQWLFVLNIILFVLAQFPLMYLIVIIRIIKALIKRIMIIIPLQ